MAWSETATKAHGWRVWRIVLGLPLMLSQIQLFIDPSRRTFQAANANQEAGQAIAGAMIILLCVWLIASGFPRKGKISN